MSEISDVVLPILQRIQADVGKVRADVTELKGDVRDQREILEQVKGYVTFTVGLHGENRADIQAIQTEITDLKKRLAVLESRS
ncbi:hypothetical protein EYW49_07860 [Siculibacillus lacustris]|uniref:Uncharacterized protein n=1 Tax=Siculibacillus lacustris TaxID=1549641 RepID=A0A4Q9VTJ7_9HYPH|nr:hypothetical protein [Siculibacillus lacustris]TBW39036.1 hypothetical protein EYW49_07860 [Siculibacillus lacustris]